MDFETMLAQLRRERDLIDRVIVSIESLAGKEKRGPGRPLGSVSKNKKQNQEMKSAAEQ
jgi:hypothetical protein